MITDFTKRLSKEDLETELDLYRGVEGIVVAPADTLTNQDMRMAEIQRLQKEHGLAIIVTEQFLKENPITAAVLEGYPETKVGDTIILTPDELAAEESGREERAKVHAHLMTRASALVEESETKADYLASCDQLPDADLEALVLKMEADLAEKNKEDEHKGNQGQNVVANPTVKTNAPQKATNADLVYLGRTVIRTENALVNGKSYKRVVISDGSEYTISPEEFDSQVKPR